jgi:hypothetical protein
VFASRKVPEVARARDCELIPEIKSQAVGRFPHVAGGLFRLGGVRVKRRDFGP